MVASEQLRPDVAAARETFLAEKLKDVPLRDVVVIDESYATTQFTRLRGRGPRGQRVIERVPHGHWKTLTMLGAITVEGVLAAATIDQATNAEVFATFVRDALVPALRPGMVVVMDNLAAHKVAGIAELIEGAGCRVEYLPPYSPDLSPIEPVWSKVKQLLRTEEAREVPRLREVIGEAFGRVTPADCYNCFADCGYTLHLR